MYVQIAVNKNKLKSDKYLQSSQLTQNYIVLMSAPEIGSGDFGENEWELVDIYTPVVIGSKKNKNIGHVICKSHDFYLLDSPGV